MLRRLSVRFDPLPLRWIPSNLILPCLVSFCLIQFCAGIASASLSERSNLSRLSVLQQADDSDPEPAPPVTPALPKAKPERVEHAEHPAASAAAAKQEILALARAGRLDSAYDRCRAALASDSDNAFLLLMMGKLSPEGRLSAEYFKKAIKAGGSSPGGSPEAEEARFRLGQFNYAAGKYHLAIPFFRDYIRLFPKGDWKDPAYYWMGNACLSLAQSRPDRAAYLDSGAAYFQALFSRLKPDDYYRPLALEGLARAKIAKGDREGAWQSALEALDKAPDEEKPPLLLISAQLRQGADREEEKGLMARLINQYPQSPEARYLRKLNAGADTSRWKAGPGLPRPAPPPAKDSISDARTNSSRKVTETSALPKAATAETAKAAPARRFALQLGAFSQAGNAQAMMASVAKLGLNPELVESERGGKRMYQVRLGRFATSDEAEEYARKELKPHRYLSQPVLVNP